MSIDFLETPIEMQALSGDWDHLPEACSNPLLSYDWFEACAHATSPHTRIVIAALRESGVIRAIAPLAINRRFGVKTFEFLGGPICNLCEPSDFIYADETALLALLAELKTLGRPLFLDRVPSASPTASALSQRPNGMTSIPLRTGSRSLFVPIDGDWDSFEAGIPKSRRAKMRQRTNAANKLGEVSYEVIKPTPSPILAFSRTS